MSHFRQLPGSGRRRRRGILGVAALAAVLSWIPRPATAQDTDPPVIRVLESGVEIAAGALFDRAVTLTVETTDASPPVEVVATLDGASFASGGTVTGEGVHQLAITATDAAGNPALVELSFEIDTTPPSFVSVLPPAGAVTAAAEVTLTGELAGAATLTVDGQPVPLVGGPYESQFSAGPFTLSEGARSFTLIAADAAGNTRQLVHAVTRDTAAPALSITQPAAGAVLGSPSVGVVGSVSDPHLSGVTVNGLTASVTGGTFVALGVPLAEGSNPLLAEAADAAGNSATASRTVVLDTLPPSIAITDPAPGTVVPGPTITVSGSASDPHLDRIEVGGVEAALAGGSWSAQVPLAEGANTLTAVAFDALGHSASASVSAIRDSEAPAIQIEVPDDGAYLSASQVTVSGTVEEEAGIAVAVNGVEAQLAGGGFSAPGVALVEGENRLIARVTDAPGNQGVHSRIVYRDTVAPEYLAADPAAGALAVPPDARFTLRFSEPLGDPPAGAWRLETAGQPLPATGSVSGDELTVQPSAPLPSSTSIRIVLTAALADRAGNPLSNPQVVGYTTADVEPPPPPALAAAPPSPVCAPRAVLAGSSEPDALVEVAGGAGTATVRAAEADGAFTVEVSLRPETLNRLELVAVDRDGNASEPLAVEVVHDCTPPEVIGAELSGDAFTLDFSEPVAAAGLSGAVTVTGASGAIAGSVAPAGGGWQAVFTAAGPLPAEPLRLTVSTAVADLAGNPLAYPFSALFGSGVTDSFVAGRVLDAATGRPLAGASVAVVATGGVPNPDPVPEQTTAGEGRFSIPVPPGGHHLLITRPGYTPAFRFATAAAGIGADVFDPRLTPAAPPVTVGTAGGPVAGSGGSGLDVPAGAFAAPVPAAVTALAEQALPALLPWGWSPRAAAWVELGAVPAAAIELTLPVDAPNGATLTVARLDEGTLQWRAESEASVLGGTVTVAITEPGAWAAVEADSGPSAPPAAILGLPLAAAPAPDPATVVSATLTFDPEVVLPAQASEATVDYVLTGDPASGVPLTLFVREELTLIDGSVRRPPPYEADLVLYRAPDGTPRSRFSLAPSIEARALPLEMGADEVVLRPYGGETLQGGVIGPAGGSVSTPEGDRVDLPAGALAEPAPVSLARRAEANLPSPLPAAAEYLGALLLDLGGRELGAAAALTLELGAAPGAGDRGLLLAPIDLPAGPAWRPVAELEPTAGGWTTAAIDPQDLPWPGVREGGVFVFARLTSPVGFLRGTVTGAGGAALPGARVMAAVAEPPWVQLAGADGSYALPVAVGPVAAVAEDPATLDRALGAADVPAEDARVDLDLAIQTTGPQLVAVDPADGAAGVPPGIEPLLTFSEPIAAATLPAGVLLYDGASPVPIDLEATGSTVRIVPRATLRPGALHEIRVNTAIKDLQGNRLATAVTTAFTTQEAVIGAGFDPTKIHAFEPDGSGLARILGRPGAVPGGSLVFVENLSRLVSTPSVTADTDGSFEVWIEAAAGDVLLLHVVPPGGNEIVLELPPFLSGDGRGARIEPGEPAEFTTLDGVTVKIAEGTFLEPATVRVEPAPLSDLEAPLDPDFAYLWAFRLEIDGAEARKKLDLELPLPPGAVGDEFLLSRMERILSEDYWMVYDLLRRDGGRLTTQAPEGEVAGAVGAVSDPGGVEAAQAAEEVARRSIIAVGAAAGSGGIQPIAAPARMGDRQEYLPGSANTGLYTVMSHTGLLDWVAFPFGNGLISSHSYLQHGMITGLIAKVNGDIERLLERDRILVPTRRGETYSIEGRDLATGFRFFEGTFGPPPEGEITLHPPGVFGDSEAPVPVSGSPIRFFGIEPVGTATRDLAPRLAYGFADGSLTVTAEPGLLPSGAQVRLLGLDDATDHVAGASQDGSFTFSVAAAVGSRYVLALGAEVGVHQAIDLVFSEGLGADLSAISILDSVDRDVEPQVKSHGGGATVRITPRGGWRAGEAYTLRIGPGLADPAGNVWGETLAIEFSVRSSEVLDTLDLAEVRDVARFGSWLFVAAGADGLAVVDARNPGELKHVAQDASSHGVTFPFPLGDPVRAVAIDPHGRVLVAGGGVSSFGQLKIFDPLAFDPGAVGSNPSDPAVRYAAFRGSTLVSDALGGGTGTTLPEGTPRRVTVLSDDQIDRWRYGFDPPPAGLTFDPPAPPVVGSPFELTVSGAGAVAGLPVTLRNLDRGGFRRVDADAGGTWSITLTAVVGDRLELLRNRQSLAYLATLGVGIQVVDVNAFYGEAPEDPENPSLESDVLGIYTGSGDPELRLCSQPVSHLGGALIDLGTLFDAADPHPLTLVGLVGFRGIGLFESDPADVGRVSYYKEHCLDINGSARVAGMTVVEDYPFDGDNDGLVEAHEYGDYIVVTHQSAGVLILDATRRDNLVLVGWVRLPGQAGGVTVDRERRLLYVSGLGGGIYVVDFDENPSTAFWDANFDGDDDRLLETIPLSGNTNSAVLMVPELGIAFAGGLDRGLTAVGVAAPRIVVLGPDGQGVWGPIDRVVPLGVPNLIGRELPAMFRVMVALPGTVGAEIRLDVVSLGPGRLPIAAAGNPADSPALPPPALTGAEGLVLRRLADQPWQEGYQIYLSEPVVAVADLRAARAYAETAEEAELCRRCDGAALGVLPDARELLSGHTVAIELSPALRDLLASVYPDAALDSTSRSLESVPWEISPAVRQEPHLNPSFGTGDVAPGTLLHSGEFAHTVSDLAMRSRGIDVAFARTYRSQTVGDGPLGPGWDLGFRRRLRQLPNGEIEYYDGRGRRELFVKKDDRFESPTDRYAELSFNETGWTLLNADESQQRFDLWGRLIAISDTVKDSADTGSEITFAYDLFGRLVDVVDDLGRRYSLSYDGAGRLISIQDFTGRTVSYSYDLQGRLASVTSPAINTGESIFPAGLTTTYSYEVTSLGGLAAQLNARDNVVAITDGRGVTTLELDYTDADGDGRADEVTGQTWGGDPLSIAYDFSQANTSTTVTDRRGKDWRYLHDGAGRPILLTDPTGASMEWAYSANGLLIFEKLPSGRTIVVEPPPADAEPRYRGKIQRRRVFPVGDDLNGSSSELITEYQEYDPKIPLPNKIQDPRGTQTVISRNDAGLPTRVTLGFGSGDPSHTTYEYNDFGQLTREERLEGADSAGGVVTEHRYASTGPSAGFLERTIIDPHGLALTTVYEHDDRGNITAVVDPRGVRHEYVYNELDWLVEEILAASGSTDGAPALGYSTRYLYDEAGQRVEVQRSVGETGSEMIREQIDYGPLGEVVEVRSELTPGTADWITEQRIYDPNRNLVEISEPEGRVTRFVYDDRNLVRSVARGVGTPLERNESTIAYDVDSRPTERTDGRGNTWTTTYDSYGRVKEEIDPLGHRTVTAYDNGANPLRISALDAEAGLLAQRTIAYDALARPVTETDWLWHYPETPPAEPPVEPPADAVQLTRSTRYDDLSRVTSTTDRRGHTNTFSYDAAARLITEEDALGNRLEHEHDPAGNPVLTTEVETLPGGGWTQTSVQYGYDALGRQIRITDGLGNSSLTHFDASGNVVRAIDADGSFSTYFYDGLDRLVKTVRPGELSTTFEYDAASRRTALIDALGNRTEWSYDVLDDLVSVAYSDGATELFSFDANGNLTERIDPRGVVVDQVFDAANRLTSRSILLPPGVGGVTAEAFAHDGLGREVTSSSGSVVTHYRYDSLSRILSEETGGNSFDYTYDPEGAVIASTTPSGKVIHRTPDLLGRTALIEHDAGVGRSQKAVYAYRGSSLIAEMVLGVAVGGAVEYDLARRPVHRRFLDFNGESPFDESVTWSARGLAAGMTRAELNDTGAAYTTDPAGRLLASERTRQGTPSNSSPVPGLPERHSFVLDRADNVLAQSRALACEADATALPLDGSGRNRPASVGGVPLIWDAAGNLASKGDLQIVYDYRNRPVRVIDGAAEIARYEYDAAGRRVHRHLGGVEETTAWSGWQPVEVFVDGVLRARRTYGLALDEVVSLELDLSGDGEPDYEYLPIYDHAGSLSVLTDTEGSLVERYEYSPYGERWVIADSTPPAVEQVRIVGQEIWIEVSEEVLLERLRAALGSGELALTHLAEGPVALRVDQPVTMGREAGRRIVLERADPNDPAWPEVGETVRLELVAGALRDTFGNESTTAVDLTFPWPAAGALLEDSTAPRLTQVCLRPDRTLELTFSEEPDALAPASVIAVDGAAVSWTLSGDRYSLVSETPLSPGAHDLSVGTGPLDLVGLGLAAAFGETFTVAASGGGQVVYSAPEPGLLTASTVGNPLGFHGLVHDGETGWVFARHRFLDPELARFTSVDPLGYVDSANLYQYALANPVDLADPLGLMAGQGLLEQYALQQYILSLPEGEQDGARRELNKGRALSAAYAIAGVASAASGPVGWGAGVGGFGLIQAEQRYEQLVELEDRPDGGTLLRAAYYGATDVTFLGPAEELITGVDRVTGQPLSGWGKAWRVLEVLPVAWNLRQTLHSPRVPKGVARAVEPGTVRFSQNSIGRTFSEGGTLRETIEGLQSGAISPEAFPPIRVFERNGLTFTLDNRRLFVFQQAGIPIRTVRATAEEIAAEAWKFTTRNEGVSIRVRGGL